MLCLDFTLINTSINFSSIINSEKGIDLYHENIIHMADDEDESIRQLGVIKKYGKKI